MKKIYVVICMLMPIILPAQKWNPDYTISTNYYANTEGNNGRKIAVSRDGVIHAVWQEANLLNDEYRIIYSRSTDYGETWSQRTPLSPPSAKSYFPAIAVSGDTIHVVWILSTSPYVAEGYLIYSRSVDGGLTWEEEPIDQDNGNDRPAIIVAKGGVTVVWDDYYFLIRAIHSPNQGTDWEQSRTLYVHEEEEDFGEPSIAYSLIENQPIIHVVFGRNFLREEPFRWQTDIVYIRSNDGGSNWENWGQLRGSQIDNYHFDKSTIAANNNLVQIAWTINFATPKKDRLEGRIQHITSADYGFDWSDVYTIESVNNELSEINLSIDNADLTHLVWIDYGYDMVIKYKRFMFVEWQQTDNLYTCNSPTPYPTIAIMQDIANWNKNNGIYVLWSDYGVLKFKRGWQIGENASLPNQGRHLDRIVNTTNCYSVFQGENGLFRQSSNRNNVNLPNGICDGKFPTIAVSSDGMRWTCYVTEDANGQHLKCQLQNELTTQEITIFDAERIFAPSLVLASKIGDMGYVVCKIKEGDGYKIQSIAFDQAGVYVQTLKTWDSGNDENSVDAPSISITPGDYLHFVWQKLEHGTNRIYYGTNLAAFSPDMIRHGYQPQWSLVVDLVSTDNPLTEPASNPFVEAYGNAVYVDWRGPFDEHNQNGEIWQRSGLIWPGHLPIWNPFPRNVSESPDKESDYPVQSTSAFVAWQELEDQDNWEIKLRFRDDVVRNISNTETPSQYPHINVSYTGIEVPRIYFIWTETNAPDIYELRFRNYWYIPEKSNINNIVYYVVNTGDSTPSYHCEHRDGYVRYPNYPIDFGHSQLRYRLDYLNPVYYYRTKAIAYQNTSGRFKQTLSFDNIPVDSIEFPAGRPESTEIYIPKSTYQQDLQSVLRANRIRGNFSALTSFGIEQFEIIDSAGSKYGPQSTVNTPVSITQLNNFPNPFRNYTSICYSLPVESKVSLSIYNVSGRLVKTLIDNSQSPGAYSINWDGADNQARRVPTGIYFVRLNTDNAYQTKKISIIR